MPYDLGDTVRLQAESRDAGGTLADAATAALTITLPDGTTVTPAVTNPPATTGTYTADYLTTAAGRHAVRWVFTTPDSAYTDAFDVREEVPPLIISLADAKAHLSITQPNHDDELRGWLESITEGVEHLAGRCVRRTEVERHDLPATGVRTVALHRTPALSLTSVEAILSGGTDYAVADLDLDGPTGIVQRKDGGRLCGPLRFVYASGREVIPASISAGARIVLRHLWRTRQGPGRPHAGGEDFEVTEPMPGFGYAIPHRALQLLEPYRLPPGVA